MAIALSYRTEGTAAGPPVVILHGLLGSSSNWRRISRHLAARRTVFSLDLPNHGASPHVDYMSYPDMAEDVRAFLDARAIDKAVVIGHSMGGKAAMRLALDAPRRIERLVVVDIAPSPSHHEHLPWLRAMAALDLARIERRADADALLADAVPDAAMRGFLLQNLVSTPSGFAWRINLQGIERSLPALLDFPLPAPLEPFAGPALFVRGGRSDYVRADDEARIRALFPSAEILTIAEAGHWVHAEQPERFLAALGEL